MRVCKREKEREKKRGREEDRQGGKKGGRRDKLPESNKAEKKEEIEIMQGF